MPTPQELEAKFWKALKADMTMMLGFDGVADPQAGNPGSAAQIPTAPQKQEDLLDSGASGAGTGEAGADLPPPPPPTPTVPAP
jgi:hypothetical protein